VDLSPTAIEIQYLQHKDCLPQDGENTVKALQIIKVKSSKEWKRGIIAYRRCNFFLNIYTHLKEERTKNLGVNDWIFYHSICKSNLNFISGLQNAKE